MSTVAETELEQRIGEFVLFVRDFAANRKEDFKVRNKREGAILICIEKDITLDFSL
jgi:hypothetical protein